MGFFNGVGIVLLVGAGFALYAALTLAWPGTALDRAWAINPTGYAAMRPLGPLLSIPFLALSALLALIGWGWLKRKRFAWYGAITIIALNLAGDVARGISGEWLAGLVGIVAAVLLLAYIAHPRTRARFA